MQIDLEQVPFSRRGSYFAFSRVTAQPGREDGLYFRTVNGGAAHREIFRIRGCEEHGASDAADYVTPSELKIVSPSGVFAACIDSVGRILLRGELSSVRLQALLASDYDLIVELGGGRWQFICYASNVNLMLTAVEGRLVVERNWTGVKDDSLEITLEVDPETQCFLVTIEEFGTSYSPSPQRDGFDAVVKDSAQDFAEWLRKAPQVPAELAEVRSLAAYVNWSSVVAPRGHLKRPAMFMSKNWMTNVWAWDHCFNAMALVGDAPMAAHQFFTIFDHQDEHGGIPDCVNDSFISRNFTKPAVHGWAFDWMLSRTDFDEATSLRAYEVLSAWTEWWFSCRDSSGSGFPRYNHGNDSGWDNSTAFSKFVPIESPDQIALLITQMDVLARLASRLGRAEDAREWSRRSDRLLRGLIDKFWTGDRFVARHAVTHEHVSSDSLLMYIPLVLGDRLPVDIFTTLAEGLVTHSFLTDYGLATESTTSALYESNGYWRGPVWAPSTLLIVDGLARGGRSDLAQGIAQRFCAAVSASGMAENFDALTGEGLRDRAYTWTASVFLVLASTYLVTDANPA